MTTLDDKIVEITPQVLLKAYACGIFPMAEDAKKNEIYWIEPEKRGIIPLESAHIPKRLAKTIRQNKFEIHIDRSFEGVIEACGSKEAGRDSTWINNQIKELYKELFNSGYCHTVETWYEGKLVGGLYGVHLGGAFFGESMFSLMRDASKVALAYLMARLIYGKFQLLDTQFVTDHLKTFGAKEVYRDQFQRLLENALSHSADFSSLPEDSSPSTVLQLINQTSKTGCSTP